VTAPLEDPSYEPVHKPVRGRVPDVVAKWAPASQLRWFRRFWPALSRSQDLSGFWCTSRHHIGPCCFSCDDELREGFGVQMDGWCCCKDSRI